MDSISAYVREGALLAIIDIRDGELALRYVVIFADGLAEQAHFYKFSGKRVSKITTNNEQIRCQKRYGSNRHLE